MLRLWTPGAQALGAGLARTPRALVLDGARARSLVRARAWTTICEVAAAGMEIRLCPADPGAARGARLREVEAASRLLRQHGAPPERVASSPRAIDALDQLLCKPQRRTRSPILLHVEGARRDLREWLTFREGLATWLRRPGEAPEGAWMDATLRLARRDPDFRRLVERAGPPPHRFRPSSFRSLARSIVFQQLTGRVASTIWQRLEALPEIRSWHAAQVLRVPHARLRGVGLSAAKARAVHALAQHVAEGRLHPPSLHRASDADVMQRLTAVRGIGPWTARMHLIFSLQRLDIWPVGDYGVRKGLGIHLGLAKAPSVAETEALGARYAPARSVAAWYLWRATELPEASSA